MNQINGTEIISLFEKRIVSGLVSPSPVCLQFEDGNWLLDKPQFVPAVFLGEAALGCQLPLEDSQLPAGPEPGATATTRPLARWQIKVSRFCSSYSSLMSLLIRSSSVT